MMNNRKKVLAELVAIDAWHAPLKTETGAAVFVEVAFKEGRVGGNDEEFPYTFKLRLKRALLTVTVEEPLSIDKSRIARNLPEIEATFSKIRTAKKLVEDTFGASASISPKSIAAALNGNLKNVDTTSEEDSIRIVQTIPEIATSSRPISAQKHAWSMESTFRTHMEGQPWDPTNPPRLFVKPLVKLSGIDPAIRVELSCAFEDVDVHDIQPKETTIARSIKERIGWEAREKVAIQHLKLLLTKSDLEVSDLDNRFNDIILADVLAYEN